MTPFSTRKYSSFPSQPLSVAPSKSEIHSSCPEELAAQLPIITISSARVATLISIFSAFLATGGSWHGPAGRSTRRLASPGQRRPDRRRHHRSQQLDRPQHLLVRYRADRHLHQESLTSEQLVLVEDLVDYLLRIAHQKRPVRRALRLEACTRGWRPT